jgi:hypothetical protein
MSESTVTFRHEYSESFKLKGVKHLVKQNIIDGAKGLSFMFLKKVGDGEFYKVYAMEDNGKYKVKETKGDKETESELSEADVKKMLKTSKDFVTRCPFKHTFQEHLPTPAGPMSKFFHTSPQPQTAPAGFGHIPLPHLSSGFRGWPVLTWHPLFGLSQRVTILAKQ